jgi:hypothetical protein
MEFGSISEGSTDARSVTIHCHHTFSSADSAIFRHVTDVGRAVLQSAKIYVGLETVQR